MLTFAFSEQLLSPALTALSVPINVASPPRSCSVLGLSISLCKGLPWFNTHCMKTVFFACLNLSDFIDSPVVLALVLPWHFSWCSIHYTTAFLGWWDNRSYSQHLGKKTKKPSTCDCHKNIKPSFTSGMKWVLTNTHSYSISSFIIRKCSASKLFGQSWSRNQCPSLSFISLSCLWGVLLPGQLWTLELWAPEH